MKAVQLFGALLLGLSLISPVNSSEYAETVSGWHSYEDVAGWLKSNFLFSRSRQKVIQKRLKNQGPAGLLVRSPENLYRQKGGYCGDSANFAQDALNRIDPAYNARPVFIRNRQGQTNHWVTAFEHDGKLYILDYGVGREWSAMAGIHGPYDSLDNYRDFLATLKLRKFEVDRVFFRNMPGEED